MAKKGEIKKLTFDREQTQLGNIYLYEYADNRRIPTYYPPAKVILDNVTGNVHMLPYDINFAELCSKIIKEKGSKIFKLIEKELLEDEKKEKYKGIQPKKGIYQASMKILKEPPYKYLFSYLSVIGNSDTRYDLIFDRFFIYNNQVNCILLCFQIKMYKENEKEKEPPSIEYYPNMSPDGKIMENGVYYNLDVDIHQPEEKIAEEFLAFVLKKEKAQETKAENS